MKKVLFIDRDGTLIIEPPDEQVDSLTKLEFYPGVFTWLGKIAAAGQFDLVMVTNQDGLGSPSFPETTFWPVQEKVIKAFANEGVVFQNVHIDRSFAHENKPTRKPGIGMLTEYQAPAYDVKNSFVIGDRATDIELAKNLGAKGILLGGSSKKAELESKGLQDFCLLITERWADVYKALSGELRKVFVERKTKETDIRVELNLDGTGKSDIKTGLGFFDHMLDQLAKHGLLDLTIAVNGDLHIDEHHTIEDTALALGDAFLRATGDKRGMERYGFCLPMDESLAQVAVDFGGRPALVWTAEFKREKVGEMPTEMFSHFFKSFSDAARCNINVKAEGQNEHHKIEAIFKAFAKAVKMAVRRDENGLLPTTKGVL